MSTGSTRHRVAVIGGDGIGPEVCAEALKVVAATGVSLETTDFDLGADRYLRDGVRCYPTRPWPSCAASTPSSSGPSGRRSATPLSRLAPSSAACCSASASSSTCT